MKYIIDIPDEKTYAYINDEKTFLRMPISLGENEIKSMFAPTMLKIKPYIEPDRKAIEDEVWEFASMLMNMHPDVAGDIYWSMNGGKGIGVAAEMTYQEAKAKYDAWKKRNDEIHVGDEIVLYENVKMVVTQVDHGTSIQGVDENGECYECVDYNVVKKTGRHFAEFEELLKKLVRCKDCKHWIPYDWMFSEVWQSKNMEDYPEDEMGCDCCDMNMGANDYCSRAERRGEQE